MGQERKLILHEDSSALIYQLLGHIDHAIQGVLDRLDQYQRDEDISPYLAETIRDMIFQVAMENPSRVHDLILKSLGGHIKFFCTNLEDGGGYYRLKKSAELVCNGRNDITPIEIILEYRTWMYSEAGEE